MINNRKKQSNTMSFLKKIFFILMVVVAVSIQSTIVCANNLTIINFETVSTNSSANTITYKANVSWDNSWRTTINYDSVWIFIKFSTDGGVTWQHASMADNGTNPPGFSTPADFEIIVPVDETGFFLQRSDLNSGNVLATDVTFVWDYAQDGLSDSTALAANTVNKIFGIEMVYVDEGAFYAGDGNSSSDYQLKQGSSDTEPWYIQAEEAITTTNATIDGFYYTSTGAAAENSTGSVFLIPSSFPKGYNDFYMMKYELTEGQWVSFFNTLTVSGKLNRDITSATNGGKNSDGVVNRNTISWDSSNPEVDATTTRSSRAVSYISWPDLLAYSDWAGLRPLTELEYEKSYRGEDINPIVNELVWGANSASINGVLASEIFPNSDEDGTEAILDGGSNINNNSLSWISGDGRAGGPAASQKGPLRVGIFAESSTSRQTSGSAYYGAMELSGNLYEMAVTIGRNEGRQFLGTHGDGELTALSGYEGNATNIDWPGINSTDAARGVTSTVGSGFRGGDFQSPSTKHFQVSNRTYAVKDPDSQGYAQRYDVTLGVYQGGRLGKTAP